MSKLVEQMSDNGVQVKDAERRLAMQRTFIERLRGSARDTTSAEAALEVIRDILRGLYDQRSQLRRRMASHKQTDDARRSLKYRRTRGRALGQ